MESNTVRMARWGRGRGTSRPATPSLCTPVGCMTAPSTATYIIFLNRSSYPSLLPHHFSLSIPVPGHSRAFTFKPKGAPNCSVGLRWEPPPPPPGGAPETGSVSPQPLSVNRQSGDLDKGPAWVSLPTTHFCVVSEVSEGAVTGGGGGQLQSVRMRPTPQLSVKTCGGGGVWFGLAGTRPVALSVPWTQGLRHGARIAQRIDVGSAHPGHPCSQPWISPAANLVNYPP